MRGPERDDEPADPVLGRLRSALGDGSIVSEGRVLPERHVAEALGVGRRALRKALDALEAEGTIWRRQGQGTFLSTPPTPVARRFTGIANLTSPAEILEVRLEIEPVLARYAAMRAAPVDVDALRRTAERSRAAATDAEYERWDRAFHRRIAETMRNGLFLAVFEAIEAVREDASWARLREGTRPRARRIALGDEHLAIVAAIAERRPAEAEARMREHLAGIGRDLGLGG